MGIFGNKQKKINIRGPSAKDIADAREALDLEDEFDPFAAERLSEAELGMEAGDRGVGKSDYVPPGKRLDLHGVDPRIKDAKSLPPGSGLYHSVLKDTSRVVNGGGSIQYLKAQNETMMTNMGAFIVLGTDRSDSVKSGYGAWGSDRAASIDLVVGRHSSDRNGQGPTGAQGPGHGQTWLNNSFSTDAARIYISQMADIDHYFGLAQGVSPQSIGRSGIAVKADAVRIIGRESVKIVTGPGQGFEPPETTSHGAKIVQPAPAIEFIAGNKLVNRKARRLDPPKVEMISALQGVCLGYNTRDGLRELGDIVDNTIGACNAVAEILVSVVTAIGVKHPLALGAISAQATLRTITQGNMSMYHLRGKLNTWRVNYLTPMGYKCIWSRNVKTN